MGARGRANTPKARSGRYSGPGRAIHGRSQRSQNNPSLPHPTPPSLNSPDLCLIFLDMFRIEDRSPLPERRSSSLNNADQRSREPVATRGWFDVSASALLSSKDPLVWHQPRAPLNGPLLYNFDLVEKEVGWLCHAFEHDDLYPTQLGQVRQRLEYPRA